MKPHNTKDVVVIPRTPSASELNRLCEVARATVLDIARMDGALGHDAIILLYVQRIYEAITHGAGA